MPSREDLIALADRINERMKGEEAHSGSRPMLGLTVEEWRIVEAALRTDPSDRVAEMRERCAQACEKQATHYLACADDALARGGVALVSANQHRAEGARACGFWCRSPLLLAQEKEAS